MRSCGLVLQRWRQHFLYRLVTSTMRLTSCSRSSKATNVSSDPDPDPDDAARHGVGLDAMRAMACLRLQRRRVEKWLCHSAVGRSGSIELPADVPVHISVDSCRSCCSSQKSHVSADDRCKLHSRSSQQGFLFFSVLAILGTSR